MAPDLVLFFIFSSIFSLRSLLIIFPDGDFGIVSTKCTTLTLLYCATLEATYFTISSSVSFASGLSTTHAAGISPASSSGSLQIPPKKYIYIKDQTPCFLFLNGSKNNYGYIAYDTTAVSSTEG